jgi:multicomponent Na+:H+ antiporter subunit E
MVLPFLRSVLLLTFVYLAVTANAEPANIALGLLIAGMVTLLVRPRSGPTDLRRLPGALWGLVRYTAILAVDILKNGFIVARIVLDPDLPIRPGIIAVPSGCPSELTTALSAHAITVTPGELVIGIDEQHVLYVHCLDVLRSAEDTIQAQTRRRELFSKIFS